MRRQITVRLTAELADALARRARKTGANPSEIVRTALREHLEVSSHGQGKRIDRVRRLIGSLESGQSDLAASPVTGA